MNDVSKMLPPMKLGNELTDALAVLPPITVKPEDNATDRLIALLISIMFSFLVGWQ